MSEYRVIWPEDVALDTLFTESEPAILQFRVQRLRTGKTTNVIDRARALFNNRTCRTCGYPVVTPIELNDAQLNRNGRVIPGTATLVGFRCHGCKSEWSS
jgi:hypothetical protein